MGGEDMMRNRTLLQGLAAVLLCSALAAGAETSKPRLKMFGDEPNPHGLWKTELLEASDPALMANAKRISQMAVCMDAGLEMGKDVKPSESACTRAVLKNTSNEAQIETQCPERPTTVMTMKRESKDSIFFETIEKRKGGATTTMKGRYHYVGPCSAEDGLIKADKNSEVCQQMRAEAATTDPEAVCGKFEGAQKVDCVRRVESSLETTRKACE
jgi:hypothetical protein